MQPFRKLAFVVNSEKSGAPELAQELSAIARKAGVKKIKISSDQDLAAGYFKGCDACCVIGGDGTLLGAVRGAAREDIPIIGVASCARARSRSARPASHAAASSATSGTQKSDGWVAMQASLQPSTACKRFSPPRASQPEPGTRLLQALTGS